MACSITAATLLPSGKVLLAAGGTGGAPLRSAELYDPTTARFTPTGSLAIDLALGVDDGIAIKHKRVQRFTEDTGLTNSGKRITYEYLLTMQNNKKIAARVLVTDQIPVSRNEKILVKQLAPDKGEVKPAADGALKWTLDLKPAEKRELKVKFSVDYPNEVQVSGLEP